MNRDATREAWRGEPARGEHRMPRTVFRFHGTVPDTFNQDHAARRRVSLQKCPSGLLVYSAYLVGSTDLRTEKTEQTKQTRQTGQTPRIYSILCDEFLRAMGSRRGQWRTA